MNLDQFLFDKVSAVQWSETVQTDDSLVLAGCIAMYIKTRNSSYKEIVCDYVNRFFSVEGMNGFILGRALSFLYEETKDEKYKVKVGELVNALLTSTHKDGNLVHTDGTNYTSKEVFSIMPTYAWYETSYNKKEHYIDIMTQLTYFKSLETNQNNLFSMVLADTALSMSEEIYEYYAQIKTWLKESVHKTLKNSAKVKRDFHAEENSIELAYAILRGCQSKALLPEKYEEIGKKIVETQITSFFSQGNEVSIAQLGSFLLAYAML
jgi:rhamnogalacturonyl hydrolase YesR